MVCDKVLSRVKFENDRKPQVWLHSAKKVDKDRPDVVDLTITTNITGRRNKKQKDI